MLSLAAFVLDSDPISHGSASDPEGDPPRARRTLKTENPELFGLGWHCFDFNQSASHGTSFLYGTAQLNLIPVVVVLPEKRQVVVGSVDCIPGGTDTQTHGR